MKWMQSENEVYYPDFANSTLMGTYLTKKEEEFINFILEKEHLNNSLLLDIGGGSGRFAIPLHLKGRKVVVLDSSANALSSLKNKQSDLPTIRGNGEKLPFKSGTFDIIFVIETIEYIADKEDFLRDCHKMLKEEGILIVTILNRLSYKMLHPNRRKRPEFYWTTYNKFKGLLALAGFDTKKAFGFNWIPANRSSNNSLIPYFAMIEDLLRLKYLPFISPWVIISARKSS
ncbi:class I SAM-dependent methyltransferase [Methanosarcina sp. MSH10X1]|uniref:class I SAM-dependent methyltransferase n=1 Tax=Methanosarcina sp. MSH10X1 TaxID=2507075 RepID=UPI000FFC8B6A|nr:class I SAM-dependent methyltransferase [Methanosarcina sp. MSH10X1]RXA20923.1 class I SAM-dependent methyltransferase [Methanosarcina sp. MSH10X1]